MAATSSFANDLQCLAQAVPPDLSDRQRLFWVVQNLSENSPYASQLTCTLATKTTRVLLDVIAGNSDINPTLLHLIDSALGLGPSPGEAGYSCDLVDSLYGWLSKNQEHIVAGTPIQRTVYTHSVPALPAPQAEAPSTSGVEGSQPGPTLCPKTSAATSSTSTPRGQPAAMRVMTVGDKAAGFRRSVSAQSLPDLPQPPSATMTPPPPLSAVSTPGPDARDGRDITPPRIISFPVQEVGERLGAVAATDLGAVDAHAAASGFTAVDTRSRSPAADSAAGGGSYGLQRGEPVTLLYYHKSMEAMASEVARLSHGRVLLRGVDWGEFGDGWPNTFIHQVKDARYNDVAFLACLDSPATWFAQVSVLLCLPKYAARSLHIIIPYFQGTMERVDTPGQVATTAAQAHILSSIPPCVVGPPQITLLDLHNLTTTHYFGPGVHVRPKSLVPLLLTELFALPDTANISIAFPDEGAFKRFSPKFVHLFPTVVCKKRRLPNGQRRVEIHDGAEFVAGRHVVIVDDLVQSGGTLLRCAEALVAQNAAAVSAYVSHGVFPNQSWKKFLPAPASSKCGAVSAASKPPAAAKVNFKHFWLTDSIPSTAAAVQGKAPFVVLQCAGMVWDAVLQYKQCLHGAVA